MRSPCCCLTFYKNKCIKRSCIFSEDLLQYKFSGPYTKCINIAPIPEISSAATFQLLLGGNYKVQRCDNLQLYFLYTNFHINQQNCSVLISGDKCTDGHNIHKQIFPYVMQGCLIS